MDQQLRNQQKNRALLLELELQRRRAIERMLREGGGRLPEPPSASSAAVGHVDPQQPSTSSATPSIPHPPHPQLLPPTVPTIERSISHPKEKDGEIGKPQKLLRASTFDYQTISSSAKKSPQKKRLKHRHRKYEKEDETSPDEPIPQPPHKRRQRPFTASFRPRTAKSFRQAEEGSGLEDLEKSVETIIARRKKTDSTSSSAFSIPRPLPSSTTPPNPTRVTTINEEGDSTPPFSPILIPPTNPEITFEAASREISQYSGLSPREQLEVMLDIDTSGQIRDPDASSADEAEVPPSEEIVVIPESAREQIEVMLDIDTSGQIRDPDASSTDEAEAPPSEEIVVIPESAREQIEVMLDIDTSGQKQPDSVRSKDESKEELKVIRDSGIKIITPSTSIEIHQPSDESLIDEEPAGISSFLTVPSEATSRRSSEFDSEDGRSSIQSRLSFIVQAKLHHYANDLRRRTSQVMEEVIQMDEDAISDDESEAAAAGAQQDQQASLMSLIGFDLDAEPETTTRRGCFPHHIDPFSKKYLLWLLIVVMAFFYNAFVIPFRTTFPYQTDENLYYWWMSDYFCDFIYIFDMVFIKPRLIFMRGGVTITSRDETRKHYLVSQQFKLDLACLLPLDLFYIVAGPLAAFRIPRLLKIYAFWEFFDLLDSSFSNPYAIRITRTFCYMIYIIHCNSCVYYMLSAWQAFGQLAYNYKGQWFLNKWVYNNQGNAYIRCFYFTAAVATSTGNNPSPTNVIEFAYMTFSWMMGVFVFALLLGQIRDIVYNANKNAEEFRATMDKALGECKRLELPQHVQEKVRAWFMYTWEQQKTLDESKLVDKLPLKLQTDLALSVHYTTLSKVQLFQDCDRSLLRDLVLKLRPVIFLPGEMVCNKGDVGKEMYIVNQGVLEVVSDEKDKVFATLGEGVAFGEISLLAIGGNNRRTANIRSKGYSTLFVLSKEDLNDVIKDYPEAQILLKKKAKQMLKKDKSKSSKSRKDLRDDLVKISSVSAALPTPRMLSAVAQLLPKESDVAKELNSMLNKSETKPQRLKRWSTIPDDVSDISDTEFPKRLSEIHKSKSLDEGDFTVHRDAD